MEKGNFLEIDLSDISVDPNQPRKFINDTDLLDLSESIKSIGVTTPILVRKADIENKFIVIAGERRFRASMIAGKKIIPAVLIEDDSSLENLEFIQLAENLDREELNPLDLANKIVSLQEKFTRDEIAEKLGKSSSWVSKKIAFLKFTEEVKTLVETGKIRDIGIAKKLNELSASDKKNDQEKFLVAQSMLEEGSFVAKEFFKRGYNWRQNKVDEKVKDSDEKPSGLEIISTKKVFWRGALELSEIISLMKKTNYNDILKEKNIEIETINQDQLKEIVQDFRDWIKI